GLRVETGNRERGNAIGKRPRGRRCTRRSLAATRRPVYPLACLLGGGVEAVSVVVNAERCETRLVAVLAGELACYPPRAFDIECARIHRNVLPEENSSLGGGVVDRFGWNVAVQPHEGCVRLDRSLDGLRGALGIGRRQRDSPPNWNPGSVDDQSRSTLFDGSEPSRCGSLAFAECRSHRIPVL